MLKRPRTLPTQGSRMTFGDDATIVKKITELELLSVNHVFDGHAVDISEIGKFIRVNPGMPILQWRTAAQVLNDIGGAASGDFDDHSARHENTGADEISVTDLSGLLGDSQTPLVHDTSHENGGGDEISVADLSGLLADKQTALVHDLDDNVFHAVAVGDQGKFIRANDGTPVLEWRTKAEVLADIGGAAAAHNHSADDINADVLAVARIPDFDQLTVAAGDQGKYPRVDVAGPNIGWLTAADVLAHIGAAAEGANADITSMTALELIDHALEITGDVDLSTAAVTLTVGGATWGKIENQTKLHLNYDNPTADVQMGQPANSLDFILYGNMVVSGNLDGVDLAALKTSFDDHSALHENGGGDEISVLGLSGLLADDQNPVAHASDHENTGADEISVADLSGLLADKQTALVHDLDDNVFHAVAVGDQGKFIRANDGTPVLEWRTKAEVLADIGGAASGHTHAIADLSDVPAWVGGDAGKALRVAGSGLALEWAI